MPRSWLTRKFMFLVGVNAKFCLLESGAGLAAAPPNEQSLAAMPERRQGAQPQHGIARPPRHWPFSVDGPTSMRIAL